MFEKYPGEKYERRMMIGAFLVILGMFLPLFRVTHTAQWPWAGVEIEGTIYGFSMAFGQIYLLIAAIFTGLNLLPVKEKNEEIKFCALTFLGSLIILLFVINILIPIFTGPSPHIGILFVFSGCVAIGSGLRIGYEKL